MTEVEMMQQVVAILTQTREISDNLEDIDEDSDVSEASLRAGELIAEVLRVDGITISDPHPQAVSDAVMAALQPRVGLLAASFIAAFTRLAMVHDNGEATSSADVLRDLALEWAMTEEDE
jgi:predicted nucleic acid-binding protein